MKNVSFVTIKRETQRIKGSEIELVPEVPGRRNGWRNNETVPTKFEVPPQIVAFSDPWKHNYLISLHAGFGTELASRRRV
jgi:hypothetical protein